MHRYTERKIKQILSREKQARIFVYMEGFRLHYGIDSMHRTPEGVRYNKLVRLAGRTAQIRFTD